MSTLQYEESKESMQSESDAKSTSRGFNY